MSFKRRITIVNSSSMKPLAGKWMEAFCMAEGSDSWWGRIRAAVWGGGEAVENPSHIGDAQCVADAILGRPDAVDLLIRRARPEIHRVVDGVRRTGDDPARMSQAIFIRVFHMLRHCPAAQPLKEWVTHTALSIATGESQGLWVDARLEPWPADAIDLMRRLGEQRSDVTDDEAHAARLLYERLLDSLPPAERLVKRLHDLKDHRVEDIHEWTGWSMNRVALLLRRGTRRVDALLAEICCAGCDGSKLGMED